MKTQPKIEARLSWFIKQFTGWAFAGDTPDNRGQCVGLAQVWIDCLGLPHVWGNAKDMLLDADPKSFRRNVNTPTNCPLPGDIVVWGPSWGAGYGHTGIAVTATVMDMVVFQQNDPDGSTPHLKTYSYSGVSGWLHPLVKP